MLHRKKKNKCKQKKKASTERNPEQIEKTKANGCIVHTSKKNKVNLTPVSLGVRTVATVPLVIYLQHS